jgi:hypothetical protein
MFMRQQRESFVARQPALLRSFSSKSVNHPMPFASKSFLAPILSASFLFVLSLVASAGEPVRLRLEQFENPVGVDRPQPSFSWQMKSDVPR